MRLSLLTALLGPPRINLLRERDFLVIPVQPFIHSFWVERYNLAIRQNLHMFLLKIRSSSNVIHEWKIKWNLGLWKKTKRASTFFFPRLVMGCQQMFSSLELLFKKQTIDKDLPKIVTININIWKKKNSKIFKQLVRTWAVYSSKYVTLEKSEEHSRN